MQGVGLHSGAHCQLHSLGSGHSPFHLCASYFTARWEACLPLFLTRVIFNSVFYSRISGRKNRLVLWRSSHSNQVWADCPCRMWQEMHPCAKEVWGSLLHARWCLSWRFPHVPSAWTQPSFSFPWDQWLPSHCGEAGFSAPEPGFQWIPKATGIQPPQTTAGAAGISAHTALCPAAS